MPANSYYTSGLSTNGTGVPAKHISSAAPQSAVKQTAIFEIRTYDALCYCIHCHCQVKAVKVLSAVTAL